VFIHRGKFYEIFSLIFPKDNFSNDEHERDGCFAFRTLDIS
jgi:hypothetical protein